MDFLIALGVALIVSAASLVLSELLRPKPKLEDAKPGNLGDINFPTATEGRVIPVLFGTVKVDGPNVVWYGDFRQEAITKNIKTGLWSSERITTGFKYYVGIQLATCLGEINAVRRIWIGDKEVWSGTVSDGTIDINEPNLFGGDSLGSGGMVGTFRVKPGSQTQLATAYLTTHQTPAIPYRGTCYITWEGGLIGNTTGLKPFKFEIERFPNQLGISGGMEIVNGADANPACLIYEYLTNEDWGLGLPVTEVNVGNLLFQGEVLYNEGNGISLIVDRSREGTDFLAEVERQIDGKLIFDMKLGLWTLLLVRGGYDIDLVPQLTSANIKEVKKFDGGTWEKTIGDFRVQFSDRARDYFNTSARLDDLANIRIQGRRVMASKRYPGVKDKVLANKLAARGLMQGSVPLKTATILTDRSTWAIRPTDVVAWTDANMGYTKLPMRVLSVFLGEIDQGTIELQLQQDVYGFTAEIGAAPDGTLWTEPTQAVAAIPADEQVVIEAPYAILRRDQDVSDVIFDRLWCGARRQTGAEALFKIYQRNAVGTPAGAYTESGQVYAFLKIGDLRTALLPSDGSPGAAIVEIDPDPDALSELEDRFTANPAVADLGQNLINLCYMGGEWFAPRAVVNVSTYLQLTQGYRGLLDSVPKAHAINTPVFLAFVGGGLSDDTIPQPNNVDVQLRPVSRSNELSEGGSTTIAIAMNNRARRAIAPAEPTINATRYDTTPDPDDLKSGGSTLDERGLDIDFNRRDYRTLDEVQALVNDGADLSGDFPAVNSHENRLVLVEKDTTLLTGLQAFWKLGESSGSRADSGPNGYTLTDFNTVTQVAGKIGNAAQFTRTNSESLDSADNTVLNYNGSQSFSFSGWFYLDSITGDSSAILSKLNALVALDHRQYAFLFNLGTNRMRFAVSSDGTAANTTNLDANVLGVPSTSTWYHFYVDYDGTTGEMRLRINHGKYDRTIHAGGVFDATSATFLLGTLLGGGGTKALFHNGRIDALGSWDRKLTENEQFMLYNGASGQEHPFANRITYLSTGWGTFKNQFVSRTELAELAGGSLPESTLQLTIESRHTFGSTVHEAIDLIDYDLALDVSDLDALTPMGVLPSSTTSLSHVALTTATYNFEIGTALGANVQARINGGAWTNVIVSPALTGTLAGVTAGDTLEVQHLDASAPPDRTLLLLKDGAGTPVPEAFAVLVPS